MKCRHEYEGTHLLWWLDGRWLRWNFAVKRGLKWGDFGARRCNQCAAWLPLGPSNDSDPRVQLEMRAAELVDAYNADDGAWYGLVSLGMCSPEAEHAPLIERDIAEGRKFERDLIDYYAGHLARCIATHGADDE